jgi:hypothetical protein
MIWEEKLYVTCGSLMTMIGWWWWSAWRSPRWRRWLSVHVRRRGRWAVMNNLKKWASSHKDHFPKTLFALSRCRITEDDGAGDLFSWLQMHIDEWDEVALVAQQRRRQKTRCVGGSWLFVVTSFVAAARIYREDPPRVTSSHNRLGLSLSKRIRHRLVAKINCKRRLRTCEALGWILADYLFAHRAPTPIASPCPTLTHPSETKQARAHVCFSLSPLLHTLASA